MEAVRDHSLIVLKGFKERSITSILLEHVENKEIRKVKKRVDLRESRGERSFSNFYKCHTQGNCNKINNMINYNKCSMLTGQ